MMSQVEGFAIRSQGLALTCFLLIEYNLWCWTEEQPWAPSLWKHSTWVLREAFWLQIASQNDHSVSSCLWRSGGERV